MAPLDDMCLLLFSYDHPNYARYTVVYVLNMLILRKTHIREEELLLQNGFSVLLLKLNTPSTDMPSHKVAFMA